MASPSLKFRGFIIRSVHVTNPAEKGSKTVTANVTADWSTTVAEKMDWGTQDEDGKFTALDLEGVSKASLKGSLLATNLVASPHDRSVKGSIDIGLSKVGSFEIVVTKDEEGEAISRELRFQVESADEDAAAKLEAYINLVGREKSESKVIYSKQMKLGEEVTEESDDEQMEIDEQEDVSAGTLASVRVMNAGRRKRLSE